MSQQTLTGSTLTGRTVVAFDLETVTPNVPVGGYPDFEDPDDFELFGAAIAVQESGTRPSDVPDKATVLFREGRSSTAETAFGKQVVNCLKATDPDTIVTFNGDRFDKPMTAGRLHRLGTDGVATDFLSLFETSDHLDLKHSAWSAYGDYTSLEELCEHQGLTVARTRWADYEFTLEGMKQVLERASGSYITGADIPTAGEVYLTALETNEEADVLATALQEYTLADVECLFKLADHHPF
jgi:hypothetical protein